MKSAVVAPALFAIAAVVQALGMHQYHQDAITLTGQLFFTLFLAGLAAFYGLRGRPERLSTLRLGLAVLSVLALVLTLAGWGANLFWFYPSVWMFYGIFVLLLVTAIAAVASNPSARQERREQDERELEDREQDERELEDREQETQGDPGAADRPDRGSTAL